MKAQSAKRDTSGSAERQKQLNAPLQKRGTVTLAPAWGGMGGARREQTLYP